MSTMIRLKPKHLARDTKIITVLPRYRIGSTDLLQVGGWLLAHRREIGGRFKRLWLHILDGPNGQQLGQSLCDRGQTHKIIFPAFFSVAYGPKVDRRLPKVASASDFKAIVDFEDYGTLGIKMQQIALVHPKEAIFQFAGLCRSQQTWEKSPIFYRVTGIYGTKIGQGELCVHGDKPWPEECLV